MALDKLLGGMSGKAAKALRGRGRSIEGALNKAMGPKKKVVKKKKPTKR